MNNIQKFDWGQIEWIYEPKEDTNNTMYVGVSTMLPNVIQPKHIHYSDEQLMYIIEGKGEQTINGVNYKVEPGMIFYIEPGSVHESRTYGDSPIKKLLISVPAYGKIDFIDKEVPFVKLDDNDNKENYSLVEAVEYLDELTISKLKFPITILDTEKPIYISKFYPQFCNYKCNISNSINNCKVYNTISEYDSPQYSGISAIVCPHGISVFTLPIIYQDKTIGYIKAGHIKDHMTEFKNNHYTNTDRLIYDTPRSTSNRIMSIMHKIKNDIIKYFDYKKTRIELLNKEELEVSFYKLQNNMLNIQINNHFLFNTLNAIANLALRDDSIETYKAIIELSKMFRYSLKKSGELISIKDEVEYLRNYINLQKLRFRDKLVVVYDIDLNLYDMLIPFNILQPIIENSFKHGFTEKRSIMKLKISISTQKSNILIKLTDNGKGMSDNTLKNVISNLTYEENLTKNGLLMVYSKLISFYDENFDFSIQSAIDKYTEVSILLPIND